MSKKILIPIGIIVVLLIVIGALFASGTIFQGLLSIQQTQPAQKNIQPTGVSSVIPMLPTETTCNLSPGPYYAGDTITATLNLVTGLGKSYSIDFDDGTAFPQSYPAEQGQTNGEDVITFTQDVTYNEVGTNKPRFSGNLYVLKVTGYDPQANQEIVEEVPVPFTALCGTAEIEAKPALKILSCEPEASSVPNGGAGGTDINWTIRFTGGNESLPYDLDLLTSGTIEMNIQNIKPDQDNVMTVHYDQAATGDLPQVDVKNGSSYDGHFQCSGVEIVEPLTPGSIMPATPPSQIYMPKDPADPGKQPPTFPSTSFTIDCAASTDEALVNSTVIWTATTEDLGPNAGNMKFSWNGTALNNDPVGRVILSKSGIYSNQFSKEFPTTQSDLTMTIYAELSDNFNNVIKTGSATCAPDVDIVESFLHQPPNPGKIIKVTDMQVTCEPDKSELYPNENVTWTATTESVGMLGHAEFTWTGSALSSPINSPRINSKGSIYTHEISESYTAPQSNLELDVSAKYFDSTGTQTRAGSAKCTPNVSVVAKPAANTAYLSDPEISVSPWDPTTETATFSVNLHNAAASNKLSAYVKDGNNLNKTWLTTNASNGLNKFTWDGTAGSSKISDGTYMFEVVGVSDSTPIDAVSLKFKVESTASSGGSSGGGSSGGSGYIIDQNLCAKFTDVTEDDPDCPAFVYNKSIGAFTGNDDGTLRPGEHLQRDQFAKIVSEALYEFDEDEDYAEKRYPFPDVTSKDWSYQYVAFAKLNDIITGYKAGLDAGLYIPDRNMNRVEFLTILVRAIDELNKDNIPSGSLASYADTETNTWYSAYAKYAKDNDLYTGNYLYPETSVTRREVAQILYKLHNQKVI